jgi:hypothetical protein
MTSSTLKLTVYGENYEELIQAAENLISDFLEIEINEISRYTNYELLVTENTNMSSDTSYEAELTVRIKYARK